MSDSEKDLWSALVVSNKNGIDKLDELFATIENLPIEDQTAIARKLLKKTGLNMVLGNNNNNNYSSGSIFFQINALDKEMLAQLFELLDKQTLGKLLAAISDRVSNEE